MVQRETVGATECLSQDLRDQSSTDIPKSWYNRATRLTHVTWGSNTGKNGDEQEPTLQVPFSYNDVRKDYRAEAAPHEILIKDGCQPRRTNYRMEEIRVEAKVDAGTGWHLLRRYNLESTHPVSSTQDNYLRHLLLSEIKEYGAEGGLFNTHTFTYYKADASDEGDTENSIWLETADNGFGGKVTYNYSAYAPECSGGDATCDNNKRHLVTRARAEDGQGNYNVTVYTYNRPFILVRQGRLVNLAVDRSTSTIYAPTTNPTGTLEVARFEEYRFHRGSLAEPDARHGRLYEMIVQDTISGTLYSHTYSHWKSYVRSGLVNFGPSAYLGNEAVWVRLEQQDDWVDDVGFQHVFTFATANQGNQQFGNVTAIDEFSHPESILDYETWRGRVNAQGLVLQRRTKTEYFPNSGWLTDTSAPYIVDRPARVIVENASGVCQAESRMIILVWANSSPSSGAIKIIASKSIVVAAAPRRADMKLSHTGPMGRSAVKPRGRSHVSMRSQAVTTTMHRQRIGAR